MACYAGVSILLITACSKKGDSYKASGIFEAKEIIVSSLAGGRVNQLDIEEGYTLTAGQLVGNVDCSQQELSVKQATESLNILQYKTADAGPNIKVLQQQVIVQQNQVNVLQEQMATTLREEARLKKLVEARAIPSKQLDDIQSNKAILQKQIESATAQIGVYKQQMEAALKNTATQNRAILAEKSPMTAREAQLKDLEEKCNIINPINGTVLTQYTYAYEMANPGKALYKIANLDTLYLKAYITGTQLGEIKLGQTVEVITNQGEDTKSTYPGMIIWISDKAEFTPKSIMTVDERANLVYPVKIKTANDGKIKIGMFAEINWEWLS